MSKALTSVKFFSCLLFCMMLLTLSSNAAVPPAGHVVVVLEENHSYSSVIGNSSMPYLNGLARQYGLATQYYANTHPSIGDYFMMTTGAIITNNDSFTGTVTNNNVVRQLLTAGKTWKCYAEDLPSVGYTGGDVYPYAQHHNPFSYISDVVNSNVQKLNLVPFSQFSNDLANGQLPNYSFVVPNLLDDAHDGTLTDADNWLQANIDPLVHDASFQKDGILIIVFDEADTSDTTNGGGHVAAVVVGPNVKAGYQSTVVYQHQNLLRTTLAALGVTTFPGASSSASDMGEMFGTSSTSSSSAPVSIQSPANGATVTSPVAFSATYNNGGTANYMKVWVDGVPGNPVLNTSTLNTSLTLSIGSHTLTVEAGDSAGAYQASVNITVTSSAPPPPTSAPVSIQSPGNGATVTSPVAFSATYNKGGTANYMKVWVDGAPGNPVLNTSTLNTSLTLSSGSHTLTVEAGDSAGAYQASVNITVTSSAPPPPPSAPVSIQSPANGATGTSPVAFSATYNKGGTANYMKVWVDGVAGNPVLNTSTLNTSLTLSSGSHTLTVEAGDSAGADQASVNITVTSSAPPPPTSAPVSIQSPGNGATVTSPVAFSATYNKGGTANYMKVWVDGVAGNPVLNTSTLNTNLTLSGGAHELTVEAGDSAGAYQATVDITVSSSTPSGTSITDIQNLSPWQTCGSCGNDGGSGPQANYSMTQGISNPSMDGIAAQFSISGQAYTNAYWFHDNPTIPNTFNYLAYEFEIYVPSGLENAPEGIEFEVQQTLNGRLYNYAWQADYDDGAWRVFDYGSRSWQATSVPFQRFTPGVWHHVLAEFHAQGTQTVHDALTVDGVRTAVGIVHNSVASSGNEFANAFQLDLNSSGTAFHVYVDQMKVTWQ